MTKPKKINWQGKAMEKINIGDPVIIVDEVQKMPLPIIKSLVEIYYDFQEQRIATQHRISVNVRENIIEQSKLEEYGVLEIFNKAESFEGDVKKLLEKEIANYPIVTDYLYHLYGIGPVISSGLVAYIGNPGKYDNISKLWQNAGFGMNTYCNKCDEYTYAMVDFARRDGTTTKAKRFANFKTCPKCGTPTVPQIQKRQAGYVSNWNDKFKVLCWKVSTSFEKQAAYKKDGKTVKSGYRKLYDEIKIEERRKHPEKIVGKGKTQYNDGHIRNMTLRKISKIFLAHLWTKWREMEGLSVTDPYVKTLLGHDIVEPFIDE